MYVGGNDDMRDLNVIFSELTWKIGNDRSSSSHYNVIYNILYDRIHGQRQTRSRTEHISLNLECHSYIHVHPSTVKVDK